MNKYKKGFTPDEAALIAVNLSDYKNKTAMGIDLSKCKSIEQAKADVCDIISKLAQFAIITQSQDSEKLNGTQKQIDDYEVVATSLEHAEDIKNALIAETWHAYEYFCGNSSQKTVLEIYQEFFINPDCNDLWPEKTQLTKASLAKWFDEANEKEVSKRFKEPKKIDPINPFKKSYTAEHAALIAVGLRTYDSIQSAIESSEYQSEEIANAQWEVERGGEYTDFEVDKLLEDASISNAVNLKDALIDEIKLASEIEGYQSSYVEYCEIGVSPPNPPHPTDIVIYREEVNTDQPINHSETLITKESVSIWLLNNGQIEYAKNILPNIEDILKEKILAKHQRQEQWNQAKDSITQDSKAKDQKVKATRTPESSLIDSLGLMAWLLSTKTTKLKRADKPNALQIKTSIETVINDLGLNENTDNKIMFTNLNKDISTALKQLEGRFKL
tara:strand:+ start:1030 stop:2361 length:1332 start_codon:yes stop_codon:yes gene_type:complete